MLAVVLGILMGFGVSIQTVINTRLRLYIGSPLLASAVSFTVGTILLAILLLIQGMPIFPSMTLIQQVPWWFWTGGLLGAFWISANIFVFQQLGAVQTAIFPILGQIIAGVLVDHFAWLGVAAKPVSTMQFLGVILVLVGIIIAVAWSSITQSLKRSESALKPIENNQGHMVWLWRLFAVAAGAMIALQGAINTQLSYALQSSIQASFISFFVGMVALVVIVAIKERNFHTVLSAVGSGKPWWIWLGGVLGAAFVVLSVILVPWIGVGQMLVLILLGLLIGSLCIDSFGWFGVTRKPVRLSQFIGIAILVLGVLLIRLI